MNAFLNDFKNQSQPVWYRLTVQLQAPFSLSPPQLCRLWIKPFPSPSIRPAALSTCVKVVHEIAHSFAKGYGHGYFILGLKETACETVGLRDLCYKYTSFAKRGHGLTITDSLKGEGSILARRTGLSISHNRFIIRSGAHDQPQ